MTLSTSFDSAGPDRMDVEIALCSTASLPIGSWTIGSLDCEEAVAFVPQTYFQNELSPDVAKASLPRVKTLARGRQHFRTSDDGNSR